jgi:phage gp36-like protein
MQLYLAIWHNKWHNKWLYFGGFDLQENNRTEYKRELNDRLERAVVSFLNYPGGGEVIIGVDDNGDTVGVSDLLYP